MEITTPKKNKVIKHEEKFLKKKKIKRKYETIKMPNHKFQIKEEYRKYENALSFYNYTQDLSKHHS